MSFVDNSKSGVRMESNSKNGSAELLLVSSFPLGLSHSIMEEGASSVHSSVRKGSEVPKSTKNLISLPSSLVDSSQGYLNARVIFVLAPLILPKGATPEGAI